MKASALWPPALDRCHIRLDLGLVDEDEAGRIDAPQLGTPALAFACNIDPRLLKSEDRCFKRNSRGVGSAILHRARWKHFRPVPP
jgi:hypothetical protein